VSFEFAFWCPLGRPVAVLRDALYDTIPLPGAVEATLATAPLLRLQGVKQLGFVYRVWPSATHTRFEHSLGVYHLMERALAGLWERGELAATQPQEVRTLLAAALLHDVGHYPFSHAIEELGPPVTTHERVGRPLVTDGRVADLLRYEIGDDAPERVYALITGASASPLQGLISGSIDLDKIEYLKRDALMCGVPYGEIDVDRLLNALVVVDDPHTGRTAVALREKGLSALESLLFAKYQMYRNVYWHHAVRAATAMYKRLVEEALQGGVLDPARLASYTDEGILNALEERAPSPLLVALRTRRLHKRAAECAAAEFPEDFGEWMVNDRALTVAVENALARDLGLEPGELLLDYPAKTQMLGLDLPVLRRSGAVERLTESGWEGAINLPTLSEQLYRSARWLRVFVARPVDVPRHRLIAALQRDEGELRAAVQSGGALLTHPRGAR
jgi:HD superfamily phosphohydrolase